MKFGLNMNTTQTTLSPKLNLQKMIEYVNFKINISNITKMEEREIVYGDIEKAGIGTFEYDPKRKPINEIKDELDAIRGFSSVVSTTDEANRVSGLPGFLHLNPKLLAATILFRYRTDYQELGNILQNKRNREIQKALNEIFPSVKKGSKYMLLKGDMIRYITLLENNS